LGNLEIQTTLLIPTQIGYLISTVRPLKTATGVVGVILVGRLLDQKTLELMNFGRPNPVLVLFDLQGQPLTTSSSEFTTQQLVTDERLWTAAQNGATNLSTLQWGNELRHIAYAPFELNREPVGVFGVILATTVTQNLRNRLVTIEVTAIALIAIISGLIAASLGRNFIARPLQGLNERSTRIAGGDLVVTGVSVHSRDEIGQLATAFNQMAAYLRNTLALKLGILDSATDSIVTLDHVGNIIEHNSATEQTFGYARAALLSAPFQARLFPSDAPNLSPNLPWGNLATAPNDLLNKRLETIAQRADGRQFPVEMTIVRVPLADPPIFTTFIRDITDRKQAEDALTRYAKELERSNQELTQFAYVASHDLQEPLRMITGYLQLLARRYQGKLDQTAEEFIGFAVDGATRMQQLIRDLLAYSRVSNSEQPFVATNCEDALARVLTNLKLAIEESNALITHDALPTIMADTTQIGQLLQNLIGNALKFRGDHPLRIHVGVEQQAHAWLFSIRDNGIGLEPEYAERIFLIFQRLHTREQYPGTGIGLAICKRIVERHGGQIWVESQPQQGATFHFTIAKELAAPSPLR
jgi:PAS domain S-box-containing protein